MNGSGYKKCKIEERWPHGVNSSIEGRFRDAEGEGIELVKNQTEVGSKGQEVYNSDDEGVIN